MINNKKIFITGGAGFIGLALAEKLLGHQNEVHILDNFERDPLQYEKLARNPNLNLIAGDVIDKDKLETSLPKDIEIVIHCAAIAGIDPVLKNPVKTMNVNLVGSINVLEAASRLSNCKRVVFFSTSEVYGPIALNANENDKTGNGKAGEARWTYAVSKLAVEHLAMAYYQQKKLPATVLRPFNIYGPGQIGESAMRNFILRSLKNEPLEIHGSGTQIRAWCYVDDMVDAAIEASTRQEAVGETINVGNPREAITISRLAATVIRVLNSKSQIVFKDKKYTDVELRIPDTSKAKMLLDFEARIDLEEGICRTAEYHQKHSIPATIQI